MFLESYTKIKASRLPTLTFGLLILIYLLHVSPEAQNSDAYSYIFFHPLRPPLYPIFLWLFHQFNHYQLTFAMWTQTGFCFFALVYAQNWLQKKLHLSYVLTAFILLSTIILIFFYYEMLELIGSEGLAFPLFIVTFFLLVDCFLEVNNTKLALLALSSALLILTRAQFYYFYLLFGLLLTWYAWKKTAIKKLFISGLIIGTSILATAGINSLYQYIMYGRISYVPPATGSQLIVQAFYLADENDAQYFQNPQEKKLFSSIMKQLESQHITQASAPPDIARSLTYAYPHYRDVFNPIMGTVSMNIAGSYLAYPGPMPNDMIAKLYSTNLITLDLSKVLIRHNLARHVKFYMVKIGEFFGNIPLFISLILFLIMATARVLKTHPTNISRFHIFVLIALLTIILNTVFVVIVQAGVPRYYYYSYFLIFCLAAVFANQFLNYKAE